MKRSRRRYRLGALPLGLSPLQLGLAVAALGGIAYFAFRRQKTPASAGADAATAATDAGASPAVAAQVALTAASATVAAGTTSAVSAAVDMVDKEPKVAAAAVARELADAFVGVKAGEPVSATQNFKRKALAAGIAKGKVSIDPNAVTLALARKIGQKSGRGMAIPARTIVGGKSASDPVSPSDTQTQSDPCYGKTGRAGLDCRAAQAEKELNAKTMRRGVIR